jgi:hypothetical protein
MSNKPNGNRRAAVMRTRHAAEQIGYKAGPGLNGDYTDTCLICGRGTDTGLAFVGEVDWCIAGIVHLGIPMDQAIAMARFKGANQRPLVDSEEGDETKLMVRACQECVTAADPRMKVGLTIGEVPAYRQAS